MASAQIGIFKQQKARPEFQDAMMLTYSGTLAPVQQGWDDRTKSSPVNEHNRASPFIPFLVLIQVHHLTFGGVHSATLLIARPSYFTYCTVRSAFAFLHHHQLY
jgi:hypothetical protein